MKSHMSRVEAVALAERVRAAPGAISVRVHRRNPYDGSWRYTVSAVELFGSGRRHWTSLEEYLHSPVLARQVEERADAENPTETLDLSYEAPGLIVRVQGSGQYRLAPPDVAMLHDLDHQLTEAMHAHDEQRLHAVLGQMIALVQTRGSAVGAEELVTSETILPPDTLSLEDVQELLHDGSLIGAGEPVPAGIDAQR